MRRKRKKRLLAVLLYLFFILLVVLVVRIVYVRYLSPEKETNSVEETADSGQQEEAETSVTPEPTATPVPSPTPEPTATPVPTESPEEKMADLKPGLETRIASCSETVSVYVKDLSGGGCLNLIGGTQQKAASLIKLYVMASVYDCINQGTLTETEDIDTLLWNMITVSDNESTNELVRRLSPDGTNWDEGSKVVNAYITEHGYTDTSMGRDVQDYRETPPPGENYTSVTDCGKILEEIYRGQCVSEEYSAKMLNLLKNQTRTSKIPAGVGSVLWTANKTGELEDTENDTAIVCLDDSRAYILCVMTSNVTASGTAVSDIVGISSEVYNYFAQAGAGQADTAADAAAESSAAETAAPGETSEPETSAEGTSAEETAAA